MERPLFNKDPALIEQAKELGKHESKLVIGKDGKKHILMGTDLAFEDTLWNAMREALIETCQCLSIEVDPDADWLVDASSEMRDKALEEIAIGEDVDLVQGYDEY